MQARILVLSFTGMVMLLSAVPVHSRILPRGDVAPPFSLPSLDGSRVALRVYCGDKLLKPYINDTRHVVVLSFWATYCKPCKKELPELIQFAKAHSEDSVKFFAVCVNKGGAEKARAYIQKNEFDMEVLIDRYKVTAKRYGVESLPSLFVIGPYGTIQYSVSGYTENSDIRSRLEQVLAQIRAPGEVADNTVTRQEDVAAADTVDMSGKEPLKSHKGISPYDKWKAVTRVECGDSLSSVAQQLGVAPELIKKWYGELKDAAIETWQQGEEFVEDKKNIGNEPGKPKE